MILIGLVPASAEMFSSGACIDVGGRGQSPTNPVSFQFPFAFELAAELLSQEAQMNLGPEFWAAALLAFRKPQEWILEPVVLKFDAVTAEVEE